MKVAFLLQGFPEPSQTFVLRQIVGLLGQGIDVRIVSTGADGDWEAVPAEHRADLRARTLRIVPPPGVSVKGLAARLLMRAPFSAARRRQLRTLLAARRIGQGLVVARNIAGAARIGSAGRYDAVIAHFGPGGVRAMYLRQAGLLEGPIATVFHGYDMSIVGVVEHNLPAYRALFETTELLLPISRRWAARLEEWGAPADKIRVFHMGVDLPKRRCDPDRPLAQPLRVLAVGRFTEKKGLRYAIEGVRQCQRPVELAIAGFGGLEAELRAAAEAPGDNPVHFLGKLAHSAVLAEMERSDVLLLPSVTAANGDAEGIPVTLMEAMARGCITIATRHSGNAELVEDEVSGLLVDERSAEQIAAALERVAGGSIDVAAMRTAAWDAVAAGFDNRWLDEDLAGIAHMLAGRIK